MLHTPLTTPALNTDPLVAALVPALTAYRQWCEADGVVGLLRAARRMTLDADAADEALSATYLDVRQRMVDAHHFGRTCHIRHCVWSLIRWIFIETLVLSPPAD